MHRKCALCVNWVILLFQILVVIEPLLIDEDYYARVEGREIISNLAKVGRSLMINILLINSCFIWMLTIFLNAGCWSGHYDFHNEA